MDQKIIDESEIPTRDFERNSTTILRESEKRFGQIHPVIEAADGEVISGIHRLKADPNWKREKREDIKDPFDKVAFRFAANIQRSMSAQEKTELIEQAYVLLKRQEPDKELTIEGLASRLGITPYLVLAYGGKFFHKRQGGNLRLPEGVVLDKPVAPVKEFVNGLTGEKRKLALEERRQLIIRSLKAVPLVISGNRLDHLFIAVPLVLAEKYKLKAGVHLTANCYRNVIKVFVKKGSDLAL